MLYKSRFCLDIGTMCDSLSRLPEDIVTGTSLNKLYRYLRVTGRLK